MKEKGPQRDEANKAHRVGKDAHGRKTRDRGQSFNFCRAQLLRTKESPIARESSEAEFHRQLTDARGR